MQKQYCSNHPERYGHAVCMSCRKVICQECATEWEGINYCTACLARRRKATATRVPVLGWVAVLVACGVLFYAAQKAMVWGSALIFGLAKP